MKRYLNLDVLRYIYITTKRCDMAREKMLKTEVKEARKEIKDVLKALMRYIRWPYVASKRLLGRVLHSTIKKIKKLDKHAKRLMKAK